MSCERITGNDAACGPIVRVEESEAELRDCKDELGSDDSSDGGTSCERVTGNDGASEHAVKDEGRDLELGDRRDVAFVSGDSSDVVMVYETVTGDDAACPFLTGVESGIPV